MTRLRNPVVDQVLHSLDRGYLTKHSFELSFNKPSGEVFSAIFRDNRNYHLKIVAPNGAGNATQFWRTVEAPGIFVEEAEAFNLNGWEQAFGRIPLWLDRVLQDHFVSSPPDAAMDQLRASLEHMAENLPEPETPFTAEEAAKWSERFDTIIGRLRELEAEHKVQKSKIDELSKQLETLKEGVHKIPKRTWLKTAGNRVLDVLSTASKEGLRIATDTVVKRLLGPDQGP